MQHVFEIEDGGEFYWWSAETHDEAYGFHLKFMREAGADCDPGTPILLNDNKKLAIDDATQTAGEWAERFKNCPVPMVGTTAV